MTTDNDRLLNEAIEKLDILRNDLAKSYLHTNGFDVLEDSHTLHIFETIYDMLKFNEKFHREEVLKMIITDKPPLMGLLVEHCKKHDFYGIHEIEEQCIIYIDTIRELNFSYIL